MGNTEKKPSIASRPAYDASKRVIDIFGAVVGLVIFFPLLIIVAVAIKRTSPGPIFYRADRAGYKGQTFRILKFRSMCLEADKGSATTSRNDQRITPIGRKIRKYKIDELPQFINVLCGEMSLVGPRPEIPRYTKMYEGEEKIILLVKPGITDYSSIEFSNMNELIGDEDPEKTFRDTLMKKKNALRVKYVKNRSTYEDLKIIALTILRIFGIK